VVSKENSRLFRALLHFLVVAAAIAPASAQVFKWVDERGVTHYGERPPQGGKASEVPDKLGSPGGVPPKAPADPAAAPAQPEKTEEARRKEQCDQQRELLDRLVQNQLQSGRVQPENADAIARQEKLVAERCKGQ
jgi:Domain of unknown function (DUF4124)